MANEKEEKIAKAVHHETKKEILNESEISIILDTYDDIFSDFDPRAYMIREISDDFIQEAKKAIKQKAPGRIELKFLVPAHHRSFPDEALIKKRIKDHFRIMLHQSTQELKSVRKRGALMILLGAAFGLVATWVSLWQTTSEFLKHGLLILLEPASWFNIWSGFDQFVFTADEKKPDNEFYQRMNNMDITFTGY